MTEKKKAGKRVAKPKAKAKAKPKAKAKAKVKAKAKKNLIIVESPAKARTIEGILGRGYKVESSMGHVRDLPKSKTSVDVDNDFKPNYINIRGSSAVLKTLKSAAKDATVYLASDPDREGEAIAWHVAVALKLQDPLRLEFHEITKDAVEQALKETRPINFDLVDAYQARRVLDRLVGYDLSPIIWKKIKRGLSAGRVQSVALRLVCEREHEVTNYVSKEHWSITATLAGQDREEMFETKLVRVGKQTVGPPDDEQSNRLVICPYEHAQELVDDIRPRLFTVGKYERKDTHRRPAPPFITSTLQQEASRKLGFSPAQTMRFAQQLYQGLQLGGSESVGLITYMRTDAPRIAPIAQEEARRAIKELYGNGFVPSKPRAYRARSGAQEAHEAIRPTSALRTPTEMKGKLDKGQLALYELIWDRFVASQMADAVFDSIRVDVVAGDYLFRASARRVKFEGFLKVYEEGRDDEEGDEGLARFEELVQLENGVELDMRHLMPSQHFTKPAPRFTQASLVKALESHGVGRPSTYAAIMKTLKDREYVEVRGSGRGARLHATRLGDVVNNLLVAGFNDWINVDFTADMEKELDRIAEGDEEWVEVVRRFYTPFQADLERAQEVLKDWKGTETGVLCPDCKKPMVVRWGWGGDPFQGCSGYPDCKTTQPLEGEEGDNDSESVLEQLEETDEPCPVCGESMELKRGRYGSFYGCSAYAQTKCKGTLPLKSDRVMSCPGDGCDGYLVQRRGRGRIFYGCSRYPDCKETLSGKPTGEKCPTCGALLIERLKEEELIAVCSLRTCDYSAALPGVEDEVVDAEFVKPGE